jgi:acyl carrier protein
MSNDLDIRLIKIFCSVLEIKESDMYLHMKMDDLEAWDSLNHMKIIAALEEEFLIRFDDDLIEELTSFEIIKEKLIKII